jgi:hypothetical protein
MEKPGSGKQADRAKQTDRVERTSGENELTEINEQARQKNWRGKRTTREKVPSRSNQPVCEIQSHWYLINVR